MTEHQHHRHLLLAGLLFSGIAAAECGDSFTPIQVIQGAGTETPLEGRVVSTEGVVVGDFQGPSPRLRGFYIQDTATDNDPSISGRSNGLFVYHRDNETVRLAQRVRVTGTATEFHGQTQLAELRQITICAEDRPVPHTPVTLPFPDPVDGVPYPERYEGMRVSFPQTLTVTDMFRLGRFGELTLSAEGRLPQPTRTFPPGPEAEALRAANDRNRIILDDTLNAQNPDPILWPTPTGLQATDTVRGGHAVTGLVGVMTYTWGGNPASPNAYRVRPIRTITRLPSNLPLPEFDASPNPRTDTPAEVGGRLRLAGFNVLNYFTTLGSARRCGPAGDQPCRGAANLREFQRQRAKIIATLAAIDADVVGLVELENNPRAAITDLVAGLNEVAGEEAYAFIDTGTIGADVIKVGVIYKPAKVEPVGSHAILDHRAGFDDAHNRPPLAMSFREHASGERFTIVVNHFKSKRAADLEDNPACRSNPPGLPDCDQKDGQGYWNHTRIRAAQALVDWLTTDPTGSGSEHVLIMGDLNAYAREDPIRTIEQAGYTNLIRAHLGDHAYSFSFGGQWGYLDHALASASLLDRITGVTVWHINADEPPVLGYETAHKSAAQQIRLYAPDPFRSSDHDPVIIGLDL